MPERREIDERDIDGLLGALTDKQIAALFGMTELEVFDLRRSRLALKSRCFRLSNPQHRRNS